MVDGASVEGAMVEGAAVELSEALAWDSPRG